MGASHFALFHVHLRRHTGRTRRPNLDFFAIDHDLPYIIPVIRRAQSINPQLKFMASPWSAPAWMKMTQVLTGSVLLSSNYQTYANYFVKFIQAYQAERTFPSRRDASKRAVLCDPDLSNHVHELVAAGDFCEGGNHGVRQRGCQHQNPWSGIITGAISITASIFSTTRAARPFSS